MWCVNLAYIFLFVAMSFSFSLSAQNRDTTWKGSVTGSAKDTIHNYFLQAATISIYKASDSSLVAYTLTNSLGEFRIGNLPLGMQLTIRVSFVGYETYTRFFTIPIEGKIVHLGEFDLNKSDNSLEEVTVISSPVRMHGDTLEFNAAAFKLDQNAVAEDLLKKLPGIVIWGDGTITVNGRQISKLLVDGKPFFGGDAKVATQNIPKTAIDKVQVYQEFMDPNNPYDSITSINFKLRKNQHAGYFGLLYAGTGKNEKYEAGSNNNIFSKSDQFAIVAQTNNTNKIGNDINTLLRSSTFKGTGARIEYQPDFTLMGANRQFSGGMLFSHDFIPDYNSYKQNRLTTNSFYNHTLNNTASQIQTESFVSNDSVLQQYFKKTLNTDASEFNLFTRYNKQKNDDSLMVSGGYVYKSVHEQNASQNLVYGSQMGLLSMANQLDSGGSTTHRITFLGAYDHHGFYNSSVHRLTNWSVSYSLVSDISKLDRLLKADFANTASAVTNSYFNRKYDNDLNTIKQELSMRLGNFAVWLFGDNRALSRFQIQFENNLSSYSERRKNYISDNDSVSNIYKKNDYLTRIGQYRVLDKMAGFNIGRVFSTVLANRYQKDLSVYIEARYRLYDQSNSSDHQFQNFNQTYYSFVPTFRISYSNYQYGEYINRYSMDATVISDYPTPEQRVPLVDSSEVYFIRQGNPDLMPQNKYQLILRYRYDSYGLKNPLNYGALLRGGVTKNFFADSIHVDPAGRYIYYPINLNGYRFVRANIFFNKTFSVGIHQFQFSVTALAEKSRNPGYIGFQNIRNPGLTVSNVFLQSDTLSVYYTYRDLFAINFAQLLSFYRTKQTGFVNGDFHNTQMTTRIGMGVNPTKKFSINTNLSFNYFTYSNSSSNRYAIWNAFLSYRFLKSNNFELKFSALDLLDQNKGLINSGGNYSFSHGAVNVQHQYFMATISYFPRKFGKPLKSN